MSAVTEARREAAALAAAAEAAEADAAGLEAAALDRGADIGLADVEGHRERARGLRWRAKAAARRGEREAVAERVARLADLRSRIESYASAVSTAPLEECLDAIRAATARFGELAAAHNAAVAAFADEARAAGVALLPPSGMPRESDGGVGAGAGGVIAGGVELRPYPVLDALPAAAAAGERAILPGPVSVSRGRARPDHVVFSLLHAPPRVRRTRPNLIA